MEDWEEISCDYKKGLRFVSCSVLQRKIRMLDKMMIFI